MDNHCRKGLHFETRRTVECKTEWCQISKVQVPLVPTPSSKGHGPDWPFKVLRYWSMDPSLFSRDSMSIRPSKTSLWQYPFHFLKRNTLVVRYQTVLLPFSFFLKREFYSLLIDSVLTFVHPSFVYKHLLNKEKEDYFKNLLLLFYLENGFFVKLLVTKSLCSWLH